MSEKAASEKVAVFDTTLRDGEQAAGTRLGSREKLIIARQLALLNVDVIEAGYPTRRYAWDRQATGAVERGRDRGGLSQLFARGFRGRAVDWPRDPRTRYLRPLPRRGRRHRGLRQSAGAMRAAPHPHRNRRLGYSH